VFGDGGRKGRRHSLWELRTSQGESCRDQYERRTTSLTRQMLRRRRSRAYLLSAQDRVPATAPHWPRPWPRLGRVLSSPRADGRAARRPAGSRVTPMSPRLCRRRRSISINLWQEATTPTTLMGDDRDDRQRPYSAQLV